MGGQTSSAFDLANLSRQLDRGKTSTTATLLEGLDVDLEKIAALTF